MTHPIVEAAEQTFVEYDCRDIYDQSGEPLAIDKRMRGAIIEALRRVRKPSTIGRLTPWSAVPNVECPEALVLIQGYIDAVIKEIEAS